ncbi:MAG: LCP family protein [Actinomycetota bacterium]
MRPFKKKPEPFSAYGDSGVFRSIRTRGRKHMRHWWQWALLGFFLLITATAGYATYRYYETQGDIQNPDIEVDERGEELAPFNAMLVGSDSRAGLTEEEQFELGAGAVGGARADTLILAHIDPGESKVTMVQFPRDLYVPIAGGGDDRINSALAGGPNQLVRTVKALTGLEINQYLQVNIAGFRDLVNAIGGVEICITEPIPFDPNTGIEVAEDELGLVKFDGERALRFVRSRRFPTGDFERIRNQQKFLAAAIDKVTSISTVLSPGRINKLLDVAGDNVATDRHTTILGLKDLANDLRHFDPEHYEAYTVPNLGTARIDGASVVLPDMPAINLMFGAIDGNESPAEADGVPSIAPSTIRVAVYNGTTEEGLAATTAARLKRDTNVGDGGVRVVERANALRSNYRQTVIRYEPSAEAMAAVIAAAMPNAELKEGNTRRDVDVAVIVGRRGGRTAELIQILPIPIPPPGDLPAECR